MGVPVWEQVKNTMLITLWVFIGIEGAVVVSARAKNRRDVGLATIFAVVIALIIYILVTLLSQGLVSQSELAMMKNPSMAPLLVQLIGNIGEDSYCRRPYSIGMWRLFKLDNYGC